jgi:hypothetical protein
MRGARGRTFPSARFGPRDPGRRGRLYRYGRGEISTRWSSAYCGQLIGREGSSRSRERWAAVEDWSLARREQTGQKTERNLKLTHINISSNVNGSEPGPKDRVAKPAARGDAPTKQTARSRTFARNSLTDFVRRACVCAIRTAGGYAPSHSTHWWALQRFVGCPPRGHCIPFAHQAIKCRSAGLGHWFVWHSQSGELNGRAGLSGVLFGLECRKQRRACLPTSLLHPPHAHSTGAASMRSHLCG